MLSVLEKEVDHSFGAGRPSGRDTNPTGASSSGASGSAGPSFGARPPMPERPVPGTPVEASVAAPASPPAT
eukprot:15332256-Alexandrium_andersonii.AAC.1